MISDNFQKEFEIARNEMVEFQIKARGIKDERLLLALRNIPRHLFVPVPERRFAYDDCALPIGEGQTISQPYMVALMTELLNLKGTEKVLEIGTGSGYQAALLASLSGQVFSIEIKDDLAKKASVLLKEMGLSNIEIIAADGSVGLDEKAPFDSIIVTAASPSAPKPLIDQLSLGGRLVIPIGDQFIQTLTLFTKEEKALREEKVIGCVFVPLLGKHGFAP